MNTSPPKKRSIIGVSIILLHVMYFLLFHLVFQDVTASTSLISAVLVFSSAILFGPFAAFISGFSIDLVQVASLAAIYGQQVASGENLVPAVIDRAKPILLIILPVSGVLIGCMSDLIGNKAGALQNRLREVVQKNQSLAEQLKQYEKRLYTISSEKGSLPSWKSLIETGKLSEPLINLFLSSLYQTAVPVGIAGQKTIQTRGNSEQPNDILFNIMSKLRPDVLAILNDEGNIIQYNRMLMAVFGIPADIRLENTNFLDLLHPDSSDKARQNFARAATATIDRFERYKLRSTCGEFTKSLISAEVTFDLIDGLYALIVRVNNQTNRQLYNPNHELFSEDQRPSHAGSLTDMVQCDICCLSANGRITYISTNTCRAIGQPLENVLGQPLEKFIQPKQQHQFEQMEENWMRGRRTTLEYELLSPSGVRNILLLDAYPSMGEAGTFLGATILIDNITDTKQVEIALNHRLVIEQLISKISTRFISVKVEDLDQEICAVLNTIEELVAVSDCAIEVHRLNHVTQNRLYRSKDCAGYSKLARSARPIPKDRLELVSVPIEVQAETVGYFRLSHEKYMDSWINSDLDLIKTIGEIIISALIRKDNEMNIKLNENRLLTTLHSIGDAVIATDTDGRVILMNQQAESLTGWGWDDARHQPVDLIFRPKAQIVASFAYPPYTSKTETQPPLDDSVLLEARNGRQYFISVNQSPIVDQTQAYFGNVTVFRDVTRKKQEEDKIRYISYHDKLTDLYNRAYFEEELVRLNTRRQYPITIILGDCNGLKIANDIFGHLEGDNLLIAIAQILQKATRHEDIVARWGGDEFAIILPRTDEQAAAVIRDRILQFCAESDNKPIQPSLALGSATNTDGSNDLIQLLKIAEDRMYRHKLMESKSARNNLILSIGKMVYEKSYETEEHASRMSYIAQTVGRVIGLTDFEREELSLLTLLHDIGKVGIPDNILLKPGQLNDEEWGVMKKHSEKGYNLAKSTPELANIADSILHHHERWDGTGYPSGLKGNEIPKLARVLSIIDTYDVITNPRAYKDAQSPEYALQEIEKCAGTQFDPELTRVFIEIMKKQLAKEATGETIIAPSNVFEIMFKT